MPHIHATVYYDALYERELLRTHKTDLRLIAAAVSGYDFDDIVVIPHIISVEEMEYAENTFPLDIVIDLGVRPNEVGDETAQVFVNMLLERCHGFNQTIFGVWIRQHKSNGTAVHEPKKSM